MERISENQKAKQMWQASVDQKKETGQTQILDSKVAKVLQQKSADWKQAEILIDSHGGVLSNLHCDVK